VLILSTKTTERLKEISLLRSPKEATGLILSNGDVVELPNLSLQQSEFQVSKADLLIALSEEKTPSLVTFWHSHPSGGVGPSRKDMKQKTPFSYHLVVTIDKNEIILSWY